MPKNPTSSTPSRVDTKIGHTVRAASDCRSRRNAASAQAKIVGRRQRQ